MWSLSSWKFMTRKIPNRIKGKNIKKTSKQKQRNTQKIHET